MLILAGLVGRRLVLLLELDARAAHPGELVAVYGGQMHMLLAGRYRYAPRRGRSLSAGAPRGRLPGRRRRSRSGGWLERRGEAAARFPALDRGARQSELYD